MLLLEVSVYGDQISYYMMM